MSKTIPQLGDPNWRAMSGLVSLIGSLLDKADNNVIGPIEMHMRERPNWCIPGQYISKYWPEKYNY